MENGDSIERLNLHNNLIFNNDGSGLYFSRWGVNNPRRNIQITSNVFYHNGYGPTKDGQTYHWQTGGLYLYSANLHDVSISKNIFSENRGFQIGYSELYLKDGRSWQDAARAKTFAFRTISCLAATQRPRRSRAAERQRSGEDLRCRRGSADPLQSLVQRPGKSDFRLRPGSSASGDEADQGRS